MQAEKTQEVVRLLERASVEHLSWLMKVHSALMFPDEGRIPQCEAESYLPRLFCAAGSDADFLAEMALTRGNMQAQASRMIDKARREGRPDRDLYNAFMAAVDAYNHEAKRAEGHFRRQLAETDSLTGIANRQAMLRTLHGEWVRSLNDHKPCCVALADLDHFKRINDTYGHAAGDKVLRAAARFFVSRLRPYDRVYRYGGEEFLFCLPDTDAETAVGVLDRLRSMLAATQVPLDDGTHLTVTVSLGLAEVRADLPVEKTLAVADRALYRAKEKGRNRVEVAEDLPEEAPPQARAVGEMAARAGR